ncbi:MAG: SRPBCC family protein, partial [Pseudonocardia sp.]|nr:SRPBCC family protein [Pseudonocardia sp.]
MFDVTHHISAVARTLGTRTLDAGEARVMTLARTYPTDLADLWDACTDARRLARWFGAVTGDLRLGGRFEVQDNAGGTVQQCDPPHGFAATWEFGGAVSWITVSLRVVDADQVRLELEHVAHVADEFWTEYGPGATGIGWDLGLLGLARHLDDPSVTVDEAEFGASPEGRRFVAAAGDAW